MPGSASIVLTPSIAVTNETVVVMFKPKSNKYLDFEIYTYAQMGDSTYKELESYL